MTEIFQPIQSMRGSNISNTVKCSRQQNEQGEIRARQETQQTHDAF